MTLKIWVDIGSGNGLLPVNIKRLCEPMLTYHPKCSVTFTQAISQQVLRMISICEIGVKIVPSKLVTNVQATNELMCLNINYEETYIDQSQHNIYFVISTFILWLALFTRGQFWRLSVCPCVNPELVHVQSNPVITRAVNSRKSVSRGRTLDPKF